jgi:hypothetical protein
MIVVMTVMAAARPARPRHVIWTTRSRSERDTVEFANICGFCDHEQRAGSCRPFFEKNIASAPPQSDQGPLRCGVRRGNNTIAPWKKAEKDPIAVGSAQHETGKADVRRDNSLRHLLFFGDQKFFWPPKCGAGERRLRRALPGYFRILIVCETTGMTMISLKRSAPTRV